MEDRETRTGRPGKQMACTRPQKLDSCAIPCCAFRASGSHGRIPSSSRYYLSFCGLPTPAANRPQDLHGVSCLTRSAGSDSLPRISMTGHKQALLGFRRPLRHPSKWSTFCPFGSATRSVASARIRVSHKRGIMESTRSDKQKGGKVIDSGGPPCDESQADGVPCEEMGADCEDCDRAEPEAREVYKSRGDR